MEEITMTKSIWFVAALGLAACSGKGSEDTAGGGGDGTDGGGCQVTVSNAVPGDGSTTAYAQADIEWAISEADSSATITVTDASGGAVSGTTAASEDGLTIRFTPDSPLAASTSYTTQISVCNGGGGGTASFTTSDLGSPIACDLVGRGYRVSLASARFVEPAALGGLIGSALEQDILIGVASLDGSTIVMEGAISTTAGGPQDYCDPTIAFPPAEFADPYVQIGPQDTTISAAGVDITIGSLELSGAFASDCSYFGGGELSGELDARVLAPLLAELVGSDDPDQACTLLSSFGVTCEACSSDGAPYCASILADQIVAQSDSSSTVECVSDSDCSGCESGNGCPCAD
jgi:hypothetical protein